MNIIFQQVPDETLKKPWPVVVDEQNNIVSGRPDADFLIGFASADDVFSLDLLPEVVRADPSLAIGMVPVFGNKGDGGFFSITLIIDSCREYEGDIEQLRKYGK